MWTSEVGTPRRLSSLPYSYRARDANQRAVHPRPGSPVGGLRRCTAPGINTAAAGNVVDGNYALSQRATRRGGISFNLRSILDGGILQHECLCGRRRGFGGRFCWWSSCLESHVLVWVAYFPVRSGCVKGCLSQMHTESNTARSRTSRSTAHAGTFFNQRVIITPLDAPEYHSHGADASTSL